jgi:hypothetical protein
MATSMKKIEPQNRMAQLHYEATGNPASTLPRSAISNCFPGLEYDFKNFWRRVFVGIVLLEWDNYVIAAEDNRFKGLVHHRLLKVDGRPVITALSGPQNAKGDIVPLPLGKPGVVTMEWSNALAFIQDRHGHKVKCHFTREPSDDAQPIPEDPDEMIEVELTVRRIFDPDSLTPAEDFLRPGELTQGLCSPWQHDYRECSCYYWPASRPDYVNIEPTPEGVSRGDNWLAKGERPGEYILDDRRDSRLVSYDDLFLNWEKELRFQIRGRDAEES